MGSSPARDQHWTWPKMVRQRTWGDKSGQSGQKKCESLLLNPSSLNRNAAQAQTKVQISPWSSSCAQKNVKSSPPTAPTSQVVQMYVFTQESKAVSCRVYTTLALIDRASDLAPPPSAHSASSKHVCSQLDVFSATVWVQPPVSAVPTVASTKVNIWPMRQGRVEVQEAMVKAFQQGSEGWNQRTQETEQKVWKVRHKAQTI